MKKICIISLAFYICGTAMHSCQAAAEAVGSKINVLAKQDEKGNTPLHYAIVPHRVSVYPPVEDQHPLYHIRIVSYLQCDFQNIERLILAGADPNQANNAGETVFSILEAESEEGKPHARDYRKAIENIHRSVKFRSLFLGELQHFLPLPLLRLVMEHITL